MKASSAVAGAVAPTGLPPAGMYETCPSCGHQGQAVDQPDAESSPACGIVYAKRLKSRFAAAAEGSNNFAAAVLTPLFYTEDKIDPVIFWSRALFDLVLLTCGGYMLFRQLPSPG